MSSGATEAQIQLAEDVANLARSLALDSEDADAIEYMVRAASREDLVVLQLAQGMLLSLTTRGTEGASEALSVVAALRREIDPRLAEGESGGEPAPAASPPGWHPDPWGNARLRWWDGSAWTGHTAD